MFEERAQTLPLWNIRQLDCRRSISEASTQRTGNTFTERAEGDREMLWDVEKDKRLQVRDWKSSNWLCVKAGETESTWCLISVMVPWHWTDKHTEHCVDKLFYQCGRWTAYCVMWRWNIDGVWCYSCSFQTGGFLYFPFGMYWWYQIQKKNI